MCDKCFLCRNNTRIQKCDHCSLHCHHKCWAQYLNHLRQKGLVDIRCPQCSGLIKRKRHVTRSMTRQNTKAEILHTVQMYIDTVEVTCGKDHKRRVISELFEYLVKNMWFVNSYSSFRTTVKNKLIDFHIHNDWDGAKPMYTRMFGEEIPTEYF